ncbi:MAG: helix-turn-helix domain-containing protein [Chloroflexi bacterium]|nr:helix-turn-helix domain-containing protein [Chloroflexota bacterium]
MADYLQLNKDTVYRLIRSKKLPATRIGRAYRIPKEDLDLFMQANSTRPAVREMLFRRFMVIAERHANVPSDRLLEELEREDQALCCAPPSPHENPHAEAAQRGPSELRT